MILMHNRIGKKINILCTITQATPKLLSLQGENKGTISNVSSKQYLY